MPLLDYQSRDPSGHSQLTFQRRLLSSAMIGAGGGVLNAVCLAAALQQVYLPLFLSGSPGLWGTGIVLDLLGLPRSRVLKCSVFLTLSVIEYTCCGLLLHFPIRFRDELLSLIATTHLLASLPLFFYGYPIP